MRLDELITMLKQIRATHAEHQSPPVWIWVGRDAVPVGESGMRVLDMVFNGDRATVLQWGEAVHPL